MAPSDDGPIVELEIVDVGDPIDDEQVAVEYGARRGRSAVVAVLVAVVVVVVVGLVVARGDGRVPALPPAIELTSGDRILVGSGPESAMPTLRWRAEELDACRALLAAVAIDGMVITSAIGNTFDPSLSVASDTSDGFAAVARSEETGDVLWRADLGQAYAVALVPVGDDRLLVVTTASLLVVDRSDGSMRAQRLLGANEEPRVFGDVVLIVERGTTRPVVLVLEVRDLTERFRVELGTGRIAATIDGDRLFIVSDDAQAVDLATGAERWRTPVAGGFGVVALDDVAVVLDGNDVVGLDRRTGDERWRAPGGADLLRVDGSSVAVATGRGTAAGPPNVLRVLDDDGQERWQSVAPDFLAVVRADDPALVTSGDGLVQIRDIDTGDPTIEVDARDQSSLGTERLWVADGATVRTLDLADGAEAGSFTAGGEVCGLRPIDGGLLVSTLEGVALYEG